MGKHEIWRMLRKLASTELNHSRICTEHMNPQLLFVQGQARAPDDPPPPANGAEDHLPMITAVAHNFGFGLSSRTWSGTVVEWSVWTERERGADDQLSDLVIGMISGWTRSFFGCRRQTL